LARVEDDAHDALRHARRDGAAADNVICIGF